MKLALRAAALLCLSSAPGVAANWTGFLVDARCFGARERNVNPTDTVQTTGAYDQEDQFVNQQGYPLGGWKEISNPPS